ncbi:DUF4240 domain-containing protein [Actinomadura darangshiensis]|uniref:DUF4240 domain-containing protein n=1 Tax=Actinomadura darangshiensis TaxID=705336 RepID=A0A4V2YXX1_9ACTN|nr:DUF4240 domain-containing protein [Actinomadura darangshiensis]TDD91067.1 DUF4240 domain-containing protein [Actinomadura darangshiensis]
MTDEERFWDTIEAAWAPLATDANAARQALATRAPDSDPWEMPEISVVEKALDGFLRNLTAAARELTSGELTDLDRVCERLLYDIDRADIHEVTDGSDDGFLYARGFIVAMGRDFYTAVAADPRLAVLDADCEPMCYFFAHLHHERFGTFPDTGSGISRESCTNPTGWLD